MIPRLVPDIEGGYPERDGEGGEEEEGEGLVLENSRSWISFCDIAGFNAACSTVCREYWR